jgi:hypothetical protein
VTHDEAQALWLLSDGGDIDPAQRSALENHLATCNECRVAVESLAAADRALRAWGTASPPAPSTRVTPGAPARSRPWIPVAVAAALAGITFGSVGGYLAGSRVAVTPTTVTATATAPTDTRASFVLLLEEPASQWPPATALARPGYFEWMDSLMLRGQYEDGIRLAEDDGWYLPQEGAPAIPAGERPASSGNFSGMFVIRARDYDEAVAIARASPHLNYGGVLVRRTY